jgi:acyl-CoA thioesterase FadM
VRKATDDTLLATGRTEHISVDLAGRMASLPPEIYERLQAGLEQLRSNND